MAAIFESVIKSNPIGRWYIEIKDTVDNRSEVCLDIDEYAKKIEDLGEDYGGDIEVKWSAEDNVTQEQINEVRTGIIAFENEHLKKD